MLVCWIACGPGSANPLTTISQNANEVMTHSARALRRRDKEIIIIGKADPEHTRRACQGEYMKPPGSAWLDYVDRKRERPTAKAPIRKMIG